MTTETTARPEITPDLLLADYQRHKSAGSGFQGPSANNRCSVLGHPCDAYCYYDRTVEPKDRREIPGNLAMIFSEGRDHERTIQRDLLEMGWDVSQQQGALYWRKFQISGHRDFKISKGGSRPTRCEFKSISPYLFDKINAPEDLRTHKSWLIRRWYAQVVLYVLLENEAVYWLILKCKSSGRIKVIVFELNDQMLEYAEALLSKAQRVNEWVQIGAVPETAKLSETDICSGCEFLTVCMPTLKFGPGAKILDDAELLAMLERREELKAGALEYGELDDQVKGHARAVAGESREVVCGEFVLALKKVEAKGRRPSLRVDIQRAVKPNAGR